MTCGAYSGGYPTGYGNHRPNCCGGVGKFSSDNLIKGFSHLHQSGTGAIGIYYNYAIVTPFYGELKNAEKVHEIHNEDAKPGYYKVLFNEITAETTVSEQVAYHRYTFNKDGGKISVDFSNDGLNKIFGESFYSHAESALLKITASDEICAKVVLKNVPLFFCVKCEGEDVQSKLWENYSYLSGTDLTILDTSRPFGGEFTFDKGNAVIKVSISTQGFDEARAYIRNSADSFDDAADKAYQIWNQMLSRIDIKTDDEELKTIFYSNLYHSMLKPSNWNGESVLGVNGDVYVDFATLWDQYKTQFPLIFTLFGDVSNQIVRALINIGDSIGFLPVNFTLVGNLHTEQQQACMLAEHVFADAYYRDLKEAHNKKLLEVVKKDLNNERYQQYQSTGFCKYYTHILDMAEGCFAIADLAVKIGDLEFAERLYDLSRHWVNAFDKKTGLLSDRSWYYEGNKWNYSFRLLRNMQQRIELAGGKEKFVELLDSFFGYDKEPVVQVRTENDGLEVEKRQLDRFEGFNNEPDMETPYAYIYAGRHDRTCEIVRMGTKYMFTQGRGGIPGNNDSGGLSSCYVWNVIGVFPVSGQNLMLIGSPSVDEAVLKLSNGKEFRITTINNSEKNIYVEKIILNGIQMMEPSFKTSEMMKGGCLTLYMTDKKLNYSVL